MIKRKFFRKGLNNAIQISIKLKHVLGLKIFNCKSL